MKAILIRVHAVLHAGAAGLGYRVETAHNVCAILAFAYSLPLVAMR